MAGNNNLMNANKAKKDEFYTQLSDIEKELRHYRKHFKDKIVFCNCDDPFESNFFKYFVLNFNRLGLKKLICTCYTGSPIANTQLSFFDVVENASENKPYKAVVTTVYDKTGDGGIDMFDVAELFKSGENKLTELEGDGDFRSEECIELLKESDIVVTNPPFSLFREYVAQLMEYGKKFIIIGHQNAITYKEIFPLLKENKIWLGNGFSGNVGFFESPYEDTAKSSQHREGMIRVSGVMWFTNLDIKKRHEEMILVKKYTSENYPKYDNYDAINVDKTADIPYDYVPCWFNCESADLCKWAKEKGLNSSAKALCEYKSGSVQILDCVTPEQFAIINENNINNNDEVKKCSGIVGVPITFMDKYNPEQFEIIKFRKGNDDKDLSINGKCPYFRILIRNKCSKE